MGVEDQEEHSKMKELDAFALEQMKSHIHDRVDSIAVFVLKRWVSLVHGHQVATYFYSLSIAYKHQLDRNEQMELDVEKSWWIFSTDHRVRISCRAITSSQAFEWTIFGFIVLSCALLALVNHT